MITQPTIKIEIWYQKAEIGLIGVWHNGNLPQGTNTIGMSRMTPQSQLIFDKSDSVNALKGSDVDDNEGSKTLGISSVRNLHFAPPTRVTVAPPLDVFEDGCEF